MIWEAIKNLIEVGAAREPVVEVDGRKYWRRGGEIRHPVPDPFKCSTLEGLVTFIKEGPDGLLPETDVSVIPPPLMLHVCSPVEVRLVSDAASSQWKDRVEHAICRHPDDSRQFRFNNFQDPESFVISLLSCFTSDHDRARVLEVVGNLRADNVRTSSDDGVTQVATVKKGAKVMAHPVKNPVVLSPFRTFADIEQPPSPFILRLHDKGDDELPSVALFEVHDNSWRMACLKLIRGYLKERLSLPVVI